MFKRRTPATKYVLVPKYVICQTVNGFQIAKLNGDVVMSAGVTFRSLSKARQWVDEHDQP